MSNSFLSNSENIYRFQVVNNHYQSIKNRDVIDFGEYLLKWSIL